ncbi:hypothetical protein AB685_17670 [Bacillus sp. LL01]|nr:hypothetical protein AB685_17670 [Bacillus sp. LL01]
MGLFFQKGKRIKSSRPINVIRFILLIGVFTLLVIGYRDDFNFTYLGIASILVGITNLGNGAESHYYGEKKKVYVPEYLLSLLFLFIGSTYLA